MLKNNPNFKLTLITIMFGALICSSCVVTKKSIYFTDIHDTTSLTEIASAEFKEPTIRPDDILTVGIQTLDPNTSALFTQGAVMPAIGSNSATPTGQQQMIGYLVDKEGVVDIPLLGKINVAGLTTFEAKKVVSDRAKMYLKDPVVQVRFANYKITVIGEVARPASYVVPNEKISIVDAIGLAGDLTIYGKRENVLLIREAENKKEFVRFNLNSSEIFKSPYFYLKQNDVIYVEPGKGKIASNNAARTQTLAIVGSVLSVLIIALSRF